MLFIEFGDYDASAEHLEKFVFLRVYVVNIGMQKIKSNKFFGLQIFHKIYVGVLSFQDFNKSKDFFGNLIF